MLHLWTFLLCFSCIGAVPLTEEQVSTKGLHPKRIEFRITNGHKARLGQFPWQVAILAISTAKLVRCGGSLIDKQWILTAAHCLEDISDVNVFLGTTHYEKQPYISYSSRKEFWSSVFYMHPAYDNNDLLNDIALIKLPTPVNFTHNIKPINLVNKELPPFSKVITSGWGRTHEDKENNDLLFANMITLPSEKCKIYEPETYFGKLCAVSKGRPRQNTCGGDSGGPLVYCDETGTPFLVGITSYGFVEISCESKFPEFFTDVYQFRDWIETTIQLG